MKREKYTKSFQGDTARTDSRAPLDIVDLDLLLEQQRIDLTPFVFSTPLLSVMSFLDVYFFCAS